MAIQLKLILPSKTSLTPSEEKTMTDAAKYPELLGLTTKIRTKVMANKAKNTTSKVSIGGGVAVVVAVLLVLLIVVLVSIPTSAMSGGGNTMLGVSGKGFYGIRMVYKDDERAKNDLIGSYLMAIQTSIDAVDGKNVDDQTVDVNIEMPDEDYEIDYKTFSTDFPELAALVVKIANVVSAADNGQTSATTIEECLSEIKYFGLPASRVNNIASDISDFIEQNSSTSSGGKFEGEVSSLINLQDFTARVEMYYIKDYIFNSDEEMQSGVSNQQYVAFIFMPKIDVSFKSISLKLEGENLDGLSCGLTYNQSALSLVEADGNFDNEGVSRKLYEHTSVISASTFQDIDVGNIDALSEGLSLYDIVNSEDLNSDLYLTFGETSGVYTYKNNGLSLNLTFEEGVGIKPFIVNEYATDWS